MSEWKPLYFSLAIIFIVGGLIPFIISGFVDLEDIEIEGVIGTLVDIVQNGLDLEIFDLSIMGFNVGTVSFDLFGFTGETIRAFVINQLVAFSVIPIYIKIPLLALVIVGFIYSIVKLLPLT